MFVTTMDTKQQDLPRNRIVDFFTKKTILITGGSGFVGQVLIEKLLRSCTTLEKIYIIVRTKKNKDAKERLQEILMGPLFDCVKKQHGANIFNKVEAISGDVMAPDLALSSEDRAKIIEEAEIIYHCAATIRFEQSLKFTVLLNVRGTKLMLDLAKECTKLTVFCYVSTTYCHEHEEVLFEKLYPQPANPHTIIRLCEELDEQILEDFAKKLRNGRVNNYTFTKALAEALVGEQMDHLPVIIQRPSSIIPISKEPLPGWTNNIHGPVGLFLGVASGVIRTVYLRENVFLDCVPVDIVVNAMIASTFTHCLNRNHKIYNIAASDEIERFGVTPERILQLGKIIVKEKVALNIVLWYPNVSLKQYKIHHYFDFFVFQLLPALLVDTVFFLVGAKPFLFKIQKRIWNSYHILEYYANRRWNFDNRNSKSDRNLLNSTEKDEFKVDSEGFDVYEYFVACCLAGRRYIVKQKDEDIPVALRRMKMLRYLDISCKILFAVGLIYYIFKVIYY